LEKPIFEITSFWNPFLAVFIRELAGLEMPVVRWRRKGDVRE